jgi:hypothetical protein
MKAAVLCNGPSRVAFQGKEGYDYVIGCNIPWCGEVDSTVVLDVGVVAKWWKEKLPKIPTWFSEHAWRETKFRNRDYFMESFLGLVKPLPEYDSSGHVACSKLIELGYKEIDIYGCDSWFTEMTDSYTHQFVDSRPSDTSKHIVGWRKRWNTIIDGNPEVKITFIGESK